MVGEWKYISPELSNDIRDFIKEDGLTQKEFAEEFLTIVQSYLSNILGDNQPMTSKIRSKIAELTKIDYAYILDNTSIVGAPTNFKGYGIK